MLPQLDIALHGWEQNLKLKTLTITTVDFVKTETVTEENYFAVVQPTKMTQQNADTLDWSRAHITTHSEQPIKLGQFVEYKGKDYKVVEVKDWSDYGFIKAISEETKQELLQPTPEDEDNGDTSDD